MSPYSDSVKRGKGNTVSARNITLLIDNCVNYCGLLFSIKYTFVNECFLHREMFFFAFLAKKTSGILFFYIAEK